MINIHQRLVEGGLKQLQLIGKLILNCVVIFQEKKFLISLLSLFFFFPALLRVRSWSVRCNNYKTNNTSFQAYKLERPKTEKFELSFEALG